MRQRQRLQDQWSAISAANVRCTKRTNRIEPGDARGKCAHSTHETRESTPSGRVAKWQRQRQPAAATAATRVDARLAACSCVCTACHDSFTGHGQLGRRASQRSHYPPKQTRHAELLHSARGATLRAVQKLSPRRYGPRVPRRAHLICVISAARQAPWSTCKRRLCCACADDAHAQAETRVRTRTLRRPCDMPHYVSKINVLFIVCVYTCLIQYSFLFRCRSADPSGCCLLHALHGTAAALAPQTAERCGRFGFFLCARVGVLTVKRFNQTGPPTSQVVWGAHSA